MKETRTVEEQAAELSEAQKEKLYKIGLIVPVVSCVLLILIFVFSILIFAEVINNPFLPIRNLTTEGVSGAHLAGLFFGEWLVTWAIAYLIVFALIKIACPYYGDKKWKYIKDQKKFK